MNRSHKILDQALRARAAAKKAGTWHGFDHLQGELERKGVKDPAALAAVIGRKKFGAKGFAALAAKGRAEKRG